MSASSSRVRDSIRRIALSDPDIRALLEGYKNRGGIASDSIEIEGAADDRAICCDGSISGSGTPGSSTRDPDTDGAGQDASGGLGDDPANLDIGAGSLTGVKDCATGESVCFEGSGWIPPEGWDSPTEPPVDPTYTEGLYYLSSVDGVQRTHQTCGAALSRATTYLEDCEYDWQSLTSNECPNPDFGVSFSEIRDLCPGGQAGVSTLDCSDSYDPICDEPPPLAESWPSDSCINLANKGGKFVASKYDPEAQGTDYLKGVSEIELCDDYGNSFSLSASGSVVGGWKTIDSTSADGYLYDATGTQIARISGSEYSDPAI